MPPLSPALSPALAAYSNLPNAVSSDDRVNLGQGNTPQKSGSQSRLNIFARAWDCFTRTPAQIASNKATAQDFISKIRLSYGDKVANMASRELSAHLDKGRPLTSHRIQQILGKADNMANGFAAKNAQLYFAHAPKIIEAARDQVASGARIDREAVDVAALDLAIRKAIRNDPAFSQGDWSADVPGFIKRYSRVAAEAADQFVTQQFQPHTHALLTSSPTPLRGKASDNIMTAAAHLRLPDPAAQNTFDHAAVVMKLMTSTLSGTDPGVEGEVDPTFSHAKARVLLGHLEYLNAELQPGAPQFDDRMASIPPAIMTPAAEAHRTAVLADMRELRGAAQTALRWDGFSIATRDALVQGNRLVGDVGMQLAEGKFTDILPVLDARRTTLEAYIQQLSSGQPQDPRSQVIVDAMRQDMQRVLDGLNAVRAAVDKGFTAADLSYITSQHLDIGEVSKQFTPAEVSAFKAGGLSMATALQYKEQGIPIHASTLPGPLTDADLVGTPAALSGGNLHKPVKATFHLPGAEPRTVVFKQAIPAMAASGAADYLGINPEDAQIPARNIATHAVDGLLGFGLVPRTEIATVGGRLGVAMEFCPGTTVLTDRPVDITTTPQGQDYLDMLDDPNEDPAEVADRLASAQISVTPEKRLIQEQRHMVALPLDTTPALRRDLVKLQLLDALCAQADRHPGNYIVHFGPGGYQGLQTIDNDLSFGPKVVDPNELLKKGAVAEAFGSKKYGNPATYGVLLPTVVDTDMAAAINGTSEADLRGRLDGVLPPDEIDAAVARLAFIKTHLASPLVTIIAPGEWGGAVADARLASPSGSYVGREAANPTGLPLIAPPTATAV